MDLVLIAVASVILGVIAFSRRFRGFRTEHEVFFQYVVTLFGTFIGVFLAVAVSNRQNTQGERERVISLLSAAYRDIRATRNAASAAYLALNDTSEKDSTGFDYMRNNPQPLPTTSFEIMQNELVLRYVSPETFVSVGVSRRNLEKVVQTMSSRRLSNRRLKDYIEIYLREMEYDRDLIDTEIQYQKRVISESVLISTESQLSMRRLGLSPATIDSIVSGNSISPGPSEGP